MDWYDAEGEAFWYWFWRMAAAGDEDGDADAGDEPALWSCCDDGI